MRHQAAALGEVLEADVGLGAGHGDVPDLLQHRLPDAARQEELRHRGAWLGVMRPASDCSEPPLVGLALLRRPALRCRNAERADVPMSCRELLLRRPASDVEGRCHGAPAHGLHLASPPNALAVAPHLDLVADFVHVGAAQGRRALPDGLLRSQVVVVGVPLGGLSLLPHIRRWRWRRHPRCRTAPRRHPDALHLHSDRLQAVRHIAPLGADLRLISDDGKQFLVLHGQRNLRLDWQLLDALAERRAVEHRGPRGAGHQLVHDLGRSLDLVRPPPHVAHQEAEHEVRVVHLHAHELLLAGAHDATDPEQVERGPALIVQPRNIIDVQNCIDAVHQRLLILRDLRVPGAGAGLRLRRGPRGVVLKGGRGETPGASRALRADLVDHAVALHVAPDFVGPLVDAEVLHGLHRPRRQRPYDRLVLRAQGRLQVLGQLLDLGAELGPALPSLDPTRHLHQLVDDLEDVVPVEPFDRREADQELPHHRGMLCLRVDVLRRRLGDLLLEGHKLVIARQKRA
mmetsp:Transcript_14571/g.42113  ORF Transcript_14571/g.42113 Transcript_14571/m.42113 type:complete len:514 (+) Transcript_14571:83-1624(+)